MAAEQVAVKEVPTKPIQGQKTGTSGLRKKTQEFMSDNYLANWVQSLFNALGDEKNGKVLGLGGDGRYFGKEAAQIIIKLAAGNGFSKVVVGQDAIMATPAMSALIRQRQLYGERRPCRERRPGPDAPRSWRISGVLAPSPLCPGAAPAAASAGRCTVLARLQACRLALRHTQGGGPCELGPRVEAALGVQGLALVCPGAARLQADRVGRAGRAANGRPSAAAPAGQPAGWEQQSRARSGTAHRPMASTALAGTPPPPLSPTPTHPPQHCHPPCPRPPLQAASS
jgi:hypothetical protein